MLDVLTAMEMVDIAIEEQLGDFQYNVEWLDEYDHDYLYTVTFKFNGKKYIAECDKHDGEVRIIQF